MDESRGTTITGAELLVDALVKAGTEVFFAYPGASSMTLHQAMLARGVRVVLPRNEQGGAFAANGYARRSGKAGVCVATSGPGATNLVTGIMDAYMDSIPLVVVTAQVNQHLIGKNAFQETDIIGMTRLCVKHSYLVLHAEELSAVVQEAFMLATSGRPGPIVIDVPIDVLNAPCCQETQLPEERTRHYTVRREPSAAEVNQIYSALARSHRPCVFVGGGVVHSEAYSELRRFVERNQLPSTSSLMGIGALQWNHPLNMRWMGMHGAYAANRAVNECDLLLGIGVRFSDRVTGNIGAFAPQAKIIHCDIDESEINKNKHADMAVVCDAGALLHALNERRPLSGHSRWMKQINAWRREHPFGCEKNAGEPRLSGPTVIFELYKATKGEATVVTGVGQHQMWTAQYYGMSRTRQLLTSGGLGAMGFGLPAAIGAQIASPKDRVLLVDGDGSFQMNIQELATVYAEKLPLKMVILNNQQLGMVSQWENMFFDHRHANTDLTVSAAKRPYPVFTDIAKGYMIPAREVNSLKELPGAIAEMLKTDGPFLLDVHIQEEDYVMPMILPGKTCEDVIFEPEK